MNAMESKSEPLELIRTGHRSLLKNMTGFFGSQFEALSQRVFHTIALRAPPGSEKLAIGRPSKLTPSDSLLACVMYLKGSRG